MSSETLIRETLAERASSYEISPLTVDEIAGTAQRRTRRSRLAGGATAFTLAALMIVGFGLTGRSTEPSTLMFAGLDGENASETPTTILATDDGWLGATLVDGNVYLATSTDGESWELAESTGLSATSSAFALDEHDGRYWLAVSDDEQVQLAFSDDLSDWAIVDLPPEANEFERELADSFRRYAGPAGLVANDAGVMLKIDANDGPDFAAITGRDLSDVCDLRWSDFDIMVRDCGSEEWETVEQEIGAPVFVPRGGDSNLVFSADGSTFEVFGASGNDTRLPYSAGQRLYATDTGFGLADYLLRESADGTTWETTENDSLARLSSPSFVAARGAERLASSVVLNTPIANVLFSADGETWTSQPIDHLVNTSGRDTLDERGSQTFSVSSLVAGEAGWALAGSTYYGGDWSALDDTSVEQFSVTFDNGTSITGFMPGGPAELTNATGDVLRSWDNFEPGNPSRTGVLQDGTDYVFVNDDGDRLLSFPAETWNESVGATRPLFTYLVLFSPDGVNWSIISEELGFIAGVAVGDDEVIVATRTPLGTSSERIAVDDE